MTLRFNTVTHDPEAHVLRCPLGSVTKSLVKIIRIDVSALRVMLGKVESCS